MTDSPDCVRDIEQVYDTCDKLCVCAWATVVGLERCRRAAHRSTLQLYDLMSEVVLRLTTWRRR